MKNFLLPVTMLLTSVFCVSLCVGCGDDDNGEKSGPAPKISLTAGETAPFSVSFTALVENASKCAYVVLTERNDALTAREILSDSGIELPPPGMDRAGSHSGAGAVDRLLCLCGGRR